MNDKGILKIFIVFLMGIQSCYLSSDNQLLDTERSLIIVVSSFNNAMWCEKNLASIFSQNYTNYRVIYIDDCSTDNTYGLVKNYIKKSGKEDKVVLIRNDMRLGALANQYKAIHTCKNNYIVVILDGDDWFAHDNVLKVVNKAYQNKNVWLTYGQFESYPQTKCDKARALPQKVIDINAYREYDWVTSHLRTFYAGLFKQIRLQDLMNEGKFFTSACDFSYMFPMLEMAAGNIQFIDQVLYIYNTKNTINLFKTFLQQQLHNNYIIRSKQKYNPLKVAPWDVRTKKNNADFYLFAQDKPSHTAQTLNAVMRTITGITHYYVFYYAIKFQHVEDYKNLTKQFPAVHFIEIDPTNFKHKLEAELLVSSSDYVLCAKDNVIITEKINIAHIIEVMRMTHAHNFSLSLGLDIHESFILDRSLKQPPCVQIKKGIYAWQFKNGEQEWRNPYSLNMTLYRKQEFETACVNMSYDSTDSLEKGWQFEMIDLEMVSLCFEKSKISRV